MSGLNSLHVKTGYIEPFFTELNSLLLQIPTDLKSGREYALVKACLFTQTSYPTPSTSPWHCNEDLLVVWSLNEYLLYYTVLSTPNLNSHASTILGRCTRVQAGVLCSRQTSRYYRNLRQAGGPLACPMWASSVTKSPTIYDDHPIMLIINGIVVHLRG